ncbi:hypothetical protein OG21DRAFT_1486639 [Imleria badia]|nr:hypothetical protein OG21DRAFT_1486639 [Imleria badia]
MSFSFFTILSGLAMLVVVNTLPAENSQSTAPSEDVAKEPTPACNPFSGNIIDLLDC